MTHTLTVRATLGPRAKATSRDLLAGHSLEGTGSSDVSSCALTAAGRTALTWPRVCPRGLDGAGNHGDAVRGLCLARTHHEVVELRGPGHELGPTHSHTDLHEAGVLAGLGFPHLTHDPAGGGQAPGSQEGHGTPSHRPWAPVSAVGSRGWAGEGSESHPRFLPAGAPAWVSGKKEIRHSGVSLEALCKVGIPGEGPFVLTRHSVPNSRTFHSVTDDREF